MRYFILPAICIYFIGCGTSKHPATDLSTRKYLIQNSSIRILDFDPLGHIYILDGTERLTKYDTSGLMLCHVVNNNLGEAHSIDVGNPFKTMVFYRDQQTVVLYDRTLSEIQRIHFTDWGYHDVVAACLSPDNAIWIFDGVKKVLLKLDDIGNAILNSDPLDIIRPGSPRPDFIYDADHFLILKQTNHPISIFDDFGKYLYTTDIKEGENFSVFNRIIIMGSETSISRYDISDRTMLESIHLKDNLKGDRIYQYADRFYGVDDKGVYLIYP